MVRIKAPEVGDTGVGTLRCYEKNELGLKLE
jgi:hypothetical protein